jgi:hypothetical protein
MPTANFDEFLKNRFIKTGPVLRQRCKYLPSAESTREVTWPVPAAPTRPTRPDTMKSKVHEIKQIIQNPLSLILGIRISPNRATATVS